MIVIFLDKQFIEWFTGFTDAEGNFYIKLTDLKENTFKHVQFTFPDRSSWRWRSCVRIYYEYIKMWVYL